MPRVGLVLQTSRQARTGPTCPPANGRVGRWDPSRSLLGGHLPMAGGPLEIWWPPRVGSPCQKMEKYFDKRIKKIKIYYENCGRGENKWHKSAAASCSYCIKISSAVIPSVLCHPRMSFVIRDDK